jgi:acetyl-CoA synthetase
MPMPSLTDSADYAFAQQHFSWERVWAFFDGDSAALNIAHECIDRHATDARRVAVRIAHADGHDETLTFRAIADWSSRVAHWLDAHDVGAGDRVAVMLEPSLAFYAAMFGAMKCGAIAVPLFTLFGPDGVRLRVADCTPKILLLSEDKLDAAQGLDGTRAVIADAAWLEQLREFQTQYGIKTTADDLALFQYTSGTTRELPAAVRHTHRSIVFLMVAALYGTGIRPGDEFFCPSSPAWGHGLAHGTLAPLALGVTTGTYAGKFDAIRLLRALQDFGITNLSAAATHYRMMRISGRAGDFHFRIRKLSYTGEPIDGATLQFIDETFGVPACSMYGTTEVGVVLVNYPGATDFPVKPGSLGKPVPGVRVEVHAPDGSPCAAGEIGEIKLDSNQGPRPRRCRRLFLPCRPGRRRHHLGRLDHERRRNRGHPAEASRRARGRGDRRARPTARARGESVHHQPSLRRRGVRPRIAGLHPRTAEPPRIPAPNRVRRRTAKDTGRQGEPQGAARCRGGARLRRGLIPSASKRQRCPR